MNIELNLLEKSYQKKIIFQNLSAKFESGKRYGIAGHNGSGKSTLLKIIAGFITPNSGDITYTISDKSIPVEAIFKYVNFTAPYIDLPVDLSFYELLDFHFSLKERIEDKCNEDINEYFQLPTALPIRQFSSGMLQRVKLALVFFTKSDLVLLDEPTETLDEIGFKLYTTLIESYSHQRTIIIASNKEKDFIGCQSILKVNDYK
jgi:ABC-type multidrug transport system ATPase subunit